MADTDDDVIAPAKARRSGALLGTLVNGGAIFALSLAAVVSGGFINAKLHPLPEMQLDKDGKITAIAPPAPVAAHGEGEGKGTAALYYAIDPPLVVNFEDGAVVRFLQITMEVMAHDEKAIDSVQKNIPLIRNNLLMLMSNRDYQTMMSRDGKEQLRHEALAEIRKVQTQSGAPDVDDLLFTTFVVQ
jgi:flagellar FliL protein